MTPLPSHMGAPAGPRYKPGYGCNFRAENERRKAKKEPLPGKRICGRCRALKDLDQFNMKNKWTQERNAWCRDCTKAYSKERYLSSQKIEKLGPVLRFILEDGDEHAGMICPDCHSPAASAMR